MMKEQKKSKVILEILNQPYFQLETIDWKNDQKKCSLPNLENGKLCGPWAFCDL